jgi:hypothetical protein
MPAATVMLKRPAALFERRAVLPRRASDSRPPPRPEIRDGDRHGIASARRRPRARRWSRADRSRVHRRRSTEAVALRQHAVGVCFPRASAHPDWPARVDADTLTSAFREAAMMVLGVDLTGWPNRSGATDTDARRVRCSCSSARRRTGGCCSSVRPGSPVLRATDRGAFSLTARDHCRIQRRRKLRHTGPPAVRMRGLFARKSADRNILPMAVDWCSRHD